MYKFLAFLSVISFALMNTGIAQDEESSMNFPIDEETGKVTYEKVIKEKGVSKEALYKRANNWFQSYFTNPGGVIEKKEEGKGIWGQDRFFLWDKDDGQKRRAGLILYDINVQVKEGRYKYKITEIFKKQSPKLFINEWVDEQDQYSAYLKQIHGKMDELMSDLKDTMSQSLNQEDDDDW